MSKGKLRSVADVCGDCGALEPGWASVNRCIFLCDECCSIHRSLGRHVSHVKSLKKGNWSPSQLLMVRTLNGSGANSIWEHTLLDPANSKGGRRKPQPQDPLHTTKADFIRSKHQSLSFVFRPSKEEISSDDADLSQQLHSSVRTNNLETSLRLLSQGADANFFHPEKRTTPLHVAAQAGQALQVELLLVYGANPNEEDQHGRTPAYFARCAGHMELAERIIECLYEVTDRLSYFVYGRKPEHRKGQHLILPEKSNCGEVAEISQETRMKLQQLPNQLFEELATDVYDEVDRRETEAAWLCGPVALENASVPFLPVNPELSATRNQGRQKLARFSSSEFAALIIDILSDARRRQMFASAPNQYGDVNVKHHSELSDDDPLYDSVASDEDYVTAEQLAKCLKVADAGKFIPPQSGDASGNTISPEKNSDSPRPSTEQELRHELNCANACINELKMELQKMQTVVQKLEAENSELRRMRSNPLPNGHEAEPGLQSAHVQRPSSMYEPREGLRSSPWGNAKNQVFQNSMVPMPLPEEVMRRTDQVTKRIQELWVSMQEQSSPVLNRDTFVPCAERIRVAVAELTAIFPKTPSDEAIRSSLRALINNTARLQADCAGLQNSMGTDRSIFLQQVRSTAYDIAKATKVLVSTQIQQQQQLQATPPPQSPQPSLCQQQSI
ncbi:ARF GTPase-activating protein GIT2 [Thrips palmi]|uniref:ARF GTPase-activating protein GIT2 n=1 Tax=Thrips palmi TaxID=161013 RepID=A0A6P9A430_THRPL|nr:ARF GTPase-activating protein GIT2 [Thrips palmi]